MSNSHYRKRRSSASYCIVNSCKRSRFSGEPIKLFSFPDDDRRIIWASKCHISMNDVSKYTRICDKHFERKFYGQKHALKTAIPTLFLDENELLESNVSSTIVNLSTAIDASTTNVNNGTDIYNFVDDSPEVGYLRSMCDKYTQTIGSVVNNKPEKIILCDNCLKKEQNELYYRRQHSTVYNENVKLKKQLLVSQRMVRNLKLQLKTDSNKKIILKWKKKQNQCQTNQNPQNISQFAKVLRKMLIKKKQIWLKEEKVLAQSIYFSSPRTYNLLREKLQLNLPSVRSLQNWSPIKNVTPGINLQNISQLDDIFKDENTLNKEAVLVFDEIAIRRDLQYNITLDQIIGLADDGVHRKKNLSKHVCFFMIRGLHKKWKYIVSYFADKNINGEKLKELLFLNIEAITKIGLNIRAVICDQGSNNRNLFSRLRISPDKPYFLYGEKKIYCGYDVPHLIKSFRNQLIKHDLITEDGTVSWNIIAKMYSLDIQGPTRMCPKLNQKHIYPNSFEKMKVNLAVQILSNTCSVAIKTYVECGHFTDCKDVAVTTTSFLQKINNLFDCLNSSVLITDNPYRSALQMNNDVHKYLISIKSYIAKIKPKSKTKAFCFDGMVLTISSFLKLAEDIWSEGSAYYILLSRLNQDPLENYFSLIRSRLITNTNPSLYELGFIVAKLMSIQVITPQIINTNCEDDEDEMLVTNQIMELNKSNIGNELSEHSIEQSDTSVVTNSNDDQIFLSVIPIALDEANINNTMDQYSMRYVCGYIVFKMLKKFNCDDCRAFMTKSEMLAFKESEKFLLNKNFGTSNQEFFLKSPSEELFSLVQIQVKIFDLFFQKHYESRNIKSTIIRLCIEGTNSSPTCGEWFLETHKCNKHRIYLLQFLITLLIRTHAKWLVQKMLKVDENSEVRNKKLKIIRQ